jgi:hypothetical protein
VTDVTRRKAFLAVLAVAVAGGVAAGILLTRGGTESALAQGRPGVIGQAHFKGVHAGTVGTVKLIRDSSGHLSVRFGPDFRTQNAPELYVYLTQGGRHREIGTLRRFEGAQAYRLPSNVKNLLGSAVQIICGKCNATYGSARLEPTGRPMA